MNVIYRTPLFCFVLSIFLSFNGVVKPTSTAAAKSLETEFSLQNNQPSITQQEISKYPQHLHFYALELKKNGYLAQALAKLSEAYGEENILTDSYYDLLDKKRRAILKDIENGSPWFPGDSNSKKVIQSFKDRFEALQSSVNFFTCPLSYKAMAFPRERFINYEIVHATRESNSQDCLNSPDPWIVSTILFLARKGESKIQPQDVIQRWGSRPDLWDDVCEEQALLYLATFPADVIHRLKIHNEDIRNVIQSRLKEMDNPLLLQCSFNNNKDDTVSIDMSIRETEPYESLKWVEISIRNNNSKEFFRAMNNRSSVCAPIPPNAFGVFPVGKKEKLMLKDVKSTGMGANISNKTKYGSLMPGCKTSTDHGILKIHWGIKADNWNFPDNKAYLFVKIVPRGEKNAPWIFCSSPICNMQSVQTVETKLATVKPLLCFKENDCHDVDKITLVRLSRQKREGVMKRWSEDNAFEYNYKELSREVVDIKKLSGHKIVLRPGSYRFEYNDVLGDPPVGFYGKSEIFAMRSGYEMEIPVWAESAI